MASTKRLRFPVAAVVWLCCTWPTVAAAGDFRHDNPAGRYHGTLSCADCRDSDYRLDLFDDGVYHLHVVDSGEQAGRYDVGRWLWSTDGRVLALRGSEKLTRYFLVDAGARLRPQEAGSGALRRDDALPPVTPAGVFVGLFSATAGAALFEDCVTRRKVPVADAGGYAELERAYRRLRPSPGQALMARVNGTLKRLPPTADGRQVTTLSVDNVRGFLPQTACPPPFANAALTGIRWLLIGLNGRWIDLPTPTLRQRARAPHVPHLLFARDAATVTGAGSCNRLTGRYDIASDTIAFADVATTRMMCAQAMETERELLQALAAARKWRIAGRLLELFDAERRPLARFRAADAPG